MPRKLSKLQVRNLTIDKIQPRANNPRTHSEKQLKLLVDSLRQFGFTNPILIDEHRRILAGHGRLKAARRLGMDAVPTICLRDMTEAEIRAYVIADNRIAEQAGWDRDLLAIEFQYLTDLDLDFDVSLTGFEMAEIDLIIGDFDDRDDADSDDEVDVPLDTPAVTQLGDLWILGGKHRLYCGDATNPESYSHALGGKAAEMVFTDPPYNVPIDGHVSGLGKHRHREFAMASGEMSKDAFTDFLATVFRNLVEHSADGSIHFVCMDWRHMGEVLESSAEAYTELKNLCVWNKTNAGMGSLYRSQHELVFVLKSGTGAHINNVELGRHGRYRTNIWTYAGANSFGRTRDDDLADHPTVKPVAMIEDAILDCSRRRGTILDPFCGSGSTLLAAARTGRVGVGIELDPTYCDVILRRMQAKANLAAVHAETGRTFDDLSAARREQDQPHDAV